MSIQRTDVERVLEASGFERVHSTKKVVEYRSGQNGKIMYFRTEIGLPEYIRIVTHPSEVVGSLLAVSGVSVNSLKEFQHGSNMTTFPRRKNGGEDEIHYGRALNVASLSALSAFAAAFHKL